MQGFDFNTVNNKLSKAVLQADRLEELLYELGCRVNPRRRESEYRMPCPIHGGDGQNLVVFIGGECVVPVRWKCFSRGCHEKFKPSLVGLIHGVLTEQNRGKPVSAKRAVEYLEKFVANAPTTPAASRPAPIQPTTWQPLRLSREQVQTGLIIPSPYFVARGFSPDVLTLFDVGSSRKLPATSTVPIYDADGQCVSFTWRNEHPECSLCEGHHAAGHDCDPFSPPPKWWFAKHFPKGDFLYNHHNVRRAGSPYIVLVEGPGDVWRCRETGIPAVACFGSSLSVRQAELLAHLGKLVLVVFDNDEAGRNGAASAAGRLQSLGVAHRVVAVPPQYHDLGDMPAGELCELVHPAGMRP